jgi:hypothetical protein
MLNSDRKMIRVAPSILASYAGHYSAPPFAVTIGADGDQLTATTPSGKKYFLYAESERRIFLKEIDVQIDFLLNPQTRGSSGFLMTQDGITKTDTYR